MTNISAVFKKLIKDWNRRPLTEKDFFRLCKKLGVFVIEDSSDDMVGNGIYTVIENVPVIFINGRVKGLERLWAMFHELGHHLLHSPATCFFSDNTHHKAQSEANMFAAIALIPERYVRQRYLWEL